MESLDGLSIGQRLLRERRLLNWSQQRLAKAIGTTVISVNRWEHDKAVPQAYYREQLECSVPAQYLFHRTRGSADCSRGGSPHRLR